MKINAKDLLIVKVSVIIPVHNAESTILKTLKSLVNQKKHFDELIIVNDFSQDKSISIANCFLSKEHLKYKIINHEKIEGLSASYNKGIKKARGELVITMHADVILEPEALPLLISPLINNKKVVATYHQAVYPLSVWKKYPFWQKCLFSRLVGKNHFGLDGKFDCFRRLSLLDIGLFDGKTFKKAGEDSDIVYRLRQKGKIVKTEAKIIHIHNASPKFSLRDYIYKHKQYAEAQGALLRHRRYFGISDIIKSFFREFLLTALLLSLISPYSLVVMVILVSAYTYFYTKLVYQYEIKNLRIVILPFINFYLLFISLIYSLKGFMYGKQQI